MKESEIRQFEKDSQILGDELVKFLNDGKYNKHVTMRVLGDLLKQIIEESDDPESLKAYFVNHLNAHSEHDCVAANERIH